MSQARSVSRYYRLDEQSSIFNGCRKIYLGNKFPKYGVHNLSPFIVNINNMHTYPSFLSSLMMYRDIIQKHIMKYHLNFSSWLTV
jgi:hypothetical protein